MLRENKVTSKACLTKLRKSCFEEVFRKFKLIFNEARGKEFCFEETTTRNRKI